MRNSLGVGTKTPVFVRFSTVTYGREFPDEARDPRGFAIKFYTGEGNVFKRPDLTDFSMTLLA